MRTVAVINQKGGCGKTTTAINLSAVAAGDGKRVLLIDLDPQSHCAVGLAVPEAQIERQIGDLLMRDLSRPPVLSEWVWQVRSGLDLLPSTMALAGLEAPGRGLTGLPDRDRRLEQLLATMGDQYDWCVLDCPPSVGLLTFNALRAATNVIIPVETSFFALQGAEKQVQTIRTVRSRLGTDLKYALLPTMFDDRVRLSREILEQLNKRFEGHVTPRPIRYCTRLREAASFGQPIVEYDGEAESSNDYRALFRWIVANLPDVLTSDRAVGSSRIPDAETARSMLAANRAALLGLGATTEVKLAGTPTPLESDSQSLITEDQRARLPQDPAADPLQSGHLSQTDPSPLPDSNPLESQLPRPTPPQGPAFGGDDTATIGIRSGRNDGSFVEHTVTPDRPSVTPSTAPGARAAELAQRAQAQSQTGGSTNTFQNRLTEVRSLDDSIRHYERSATPTVVAQTRRLSGARQTRQGVLFVFPGLSPSQQVSVVGDFNDWSATANPMRYNNQLQLFEACFPIPPGRHEYQFYVDGQAAEHPSVNAYEETEASQDPVLLEVLPVGY